PLVAHRWPCHSVRFPSGERRLQGGYASIPSARFHAVLTQALGGAVWLDTPVLDLSPTSVRLADGRQLRAGAVIDGRGSAAPGIRMGWQKFIGQEWQLAAPHGLPGPILMDATVAQRGGYRFVYTLPLDAQTVLVEDTVYADGPALDDAAIRDDIASYMQAQGWAPGALRREERGVLPIVLDGDPERLWDAAHGVPRVGLAAALFHPTTGYSLPDAVGLTERVGALPDLSADALFAALRAHALAQWRRQGFFRLLNRMLFQAAEPGERWRVMQRFYRLPEPLIARFYAGRPSLTDKLRVLTGKPPVPLGAALQAALARPLAHGSPP
ncbi:MAG: lycopene cyclase, partial [Comamonadaceae bacterium]